MKSVLKISIEICVLIHEESPAVDSLDGRKGCVGQLVSHGVLGDVVAGDSRHQGGLLLGVAVGEGEWNQVETTGNIPQVTSVHSEEVRDKPARQRFSWMLTINSIYLVNY